MNYNQMLFEPAGALDPYGNQGGEFQQSRDYGKPQRQEEPMLDPQRMAWAQAVSNIGSIWADQGMSNSVGGAYAQAKAQNDKFRNNKAALARQAEQDEQQKRLFDMQIAESNKPTVVKVGKNTYMNQYPDGRLEEINGIGINDAPFEGTGMEAQTLNILFDPSIPDNDPRKIAARQRISVSALLMPIIYRH